jgi:AraC family transcriptional regulator
MEYVRVVEIPACKMVSSQCGMFGDGKLEAFDEWFSTLERGVYPNDFLWQDSKRDGFVWYYVYNEGIQVPEGFEVVDFRAACMRSRAKSTVRTVRTQKRQSSNL